MSRMATVEDVSLLRSLDPLSFVASGWNSRTSRSRHVVILHANWLNLHHDRAIAIRHSTSSSLAFVAPFVAPECLPYIDLLGLSTLVSKQSSRNVHAKRRERKITTRDCEEVGANFEVLEVKGVATSEERCGALS